MNGEAYQPPEQITGFIDESNRKFSIEERSIAEILASEGKHIKALAETGDIGRFADALVSDQPVSGGTAGILTEFKHLRPGAASTTIRNVINNSTRKGGQARHIFLYAAGSGLTETEAKAGLARARGIARGRLDSVRIIGDGFDVASTDFE